MRKLAFIVLIINTNCVFSDYTLPQFAKFFFYNGHMKDTESCGMPIYEYQIFNENPTILIEAIKKSLPEQKDCYWQEPKLYKALEDTPKFFPTQDEDWIKIKEQNKNAPKSQTWEFLCIDSNGTNKHTVYETIHPQYTCAPNRIDIENKLCTTKAYACNADIVGRDLKLPGFEEIGHVGLVLNYNPKEKNKIGNYVLQATYKDEVINIDSLSNFKEESSYWGEVYGLDEVEYISNNDAKKAIEVGWNQRQFNPQYTFTSYWQEGKKIEASVFNVKTHKWELQEGIIPAIFRCDTFINYCYSKGFNIKLPKSLIASPKNTYESFKYKREDVALANLTKKTAISQEVTEEHVQEIMKNTALSRKDKQCSIWHLIENAKKREEQEIFYYLVDRLQFEHATYLIHSMIEEYSKQDDIELKRKLQIAIYQAAITQPDQARNADEMQQVLEAQNFFLSHLKKEKNAILLKSFNLLAPGIVPKEDLLN